MSVLALSYWGCKLHLFYAILYCHLWSIWLYHILAHYLIKAWFLEERKKVIEHELCFDFLYNFFFFLMFLILRKIQWGAVNVHRSLCKVPFILLLDVNWNLNFLDCFLKNSQILWKSIQWEQSCSTQIDRLDNANSHFSHLWMHQIKSAVL